jgi:hypothetical protein
VRNDWFAPVVAVAALVGGAALVAAEDPPPNATPPPKTPLPEFANPAGDAEVGETCFFSVTGKDGRVRYYEERVLARTAERLLVEVVTASEKGKTFGAVSAASGWRMGGKEFPKELSKVQTWKPDLQKDEVLYVGPKDAPQGVRCTKRVIEEPSDLNDAESPKRNREIWYSHDVAARGIAKMVPAVGVGDGEWRAISWSKKLSAADCAKAAGAYKTAEEDAKEEEERHGGMSDSGMTDPAMKEPPPDDPSMG